MNHVLRRRLPVLATVRVTVLATVLVTAGAGCPRAIPDHLRIDPPSPATSASAITDAGSAIRVILGKDPLGRSPALPEPALLEPIEGGPPLAAFVRQIHEVESGEGPVQRGLQQVEDEWRGTAAVPLSRGYRLRIAENQLANRLGDPDTAERDVLVLITPLSDSGVDPTLPRRPLAWLGGMDHPDLIRQYAERWVLTSWVGAPGIPLAPVTAALAAPQYDALRESPAGRLITARAAGASGDPTPGLADLRRATMLALARAGADRDAEQGAWADQKKAAADELGDPDPIGKLLERAADTLTAAAADDRAAGGALLAGSALRWIGRCPDAPCVGIDRVEGMAAAARWSPEIAELAAIWQVVALKETLDSFEVGRETGLFPDITVQLADALLGTGAGPLDAQILRKQRPDAVVWLAVCRAVGAEGITDWEGARVALGQHLAREASRAAGLTTDQSAVATLERIRKRAVP
ncbi:MAG: hypothetical protein ABMB14_05925 [Myxococcota bacterium]